MGLECINDWLIPYELKCSLRSSSGYLVPSCRRAHHGRVAAAMRLPEQITAFLDDAHVTVGCFTARFTHIPEEALHVFSPEHNGEPLLGRLSISDGGRAQPRQSAQSGSSQKGSQTAERQSPPSQNSNIWCWLGLYSTTKLEILTINTTQQ